MADEQYKYVGTHAQDLPGGRVVAPGEEIVKTEENSAFLHELEAEGKAILLGQETVNATPAAIKLAEKLDVGLGSIDGTGENDRITVEDVQAAADAAKEGEEE